MKRARSFSSVVVAIVAVVGASLVPSAASAASAGGPYLYVANSGSSSVSVVDPVSLTVTATVPVPGGANAVATSSDGHRVYVSGVSMSILDTATNTVVGTIPLPSPGNALALSSNGSRLYVGLQGGSIEVIDTTTALVTATISVGGDVASMSLTPSQARLLAASPGAHGTSVIDTATNAVVATIPGCCGGSRAIPESVAVSPDGTRAYVASSTTSPGSFPGAVQVIDTATNTVLGTLAISTSFPDAVALSPDGTRAYVGDPANLYVVDLTTGTSGTLLKNVPVNGGVAAIAVSASGNRVFVSSGFGAQTVAVIDPTSSSPPSYVPVGSGARSIALGPSLAPVEPAPAGNLLDASTSTIEGSLGHWVPWFSSSVSRSTAQSHGGTHSMRVDVTAPYGWGVQLDNWPGFATAPGPMWMSFWGRLGTGHMGATMSVDWRDASGAVFRTDTVSLPSLTTTWQQASAGVVAPLGTAWATVEITNPSGVAGDSLYLDDIVVAPLSSIVDIDTSTIESSTGHWVPWFSSSISRSPVAHGSNFGLAVDITAQYGWGVTVDNWPGFVTAPGPKTIGFSALSGAATNLGATLSVDWRDAAGTVLRTDTVAIATLSPYAWQTASADVTAPAATARATVALTGTSGAPGDRIYVDDIVVADRASASSPSV